MQFHQSFGPRQGPRLLQDRLRSRPALLAPPLGSMLCCAAARVLASSLLETTGVLVRMAIVEWRNLPTVAECHLAMRFFCRQTEIRNTMNQSCTKPNTRGVRGASRPDDISQVGHLPVHGRECVGCVRHCSQKVGKRSAARDANHAGPPPLPGQES